MNIVGLKENPYFLLAMLNSKIVSYWFIHKFGKMQRGTFPQFKVNELKIFPIIQVSDKVKKSLIYLSQRIFTLLKSRPNEGLQSNEFKALNKNIDQALYQECGLTPEEIAIIEEAVS